MFRSWTILIIAVMLSASGPTALAQDHHVEGRLFSVKDGLSSPVSHDIIKDVRGFIWIATRKGLNRFDGKSFVNYNSTDNGLASDQVAGLVTGNNDLIWIFFDTNIGSKVPNGRIQVFDPSSETLNEFDDRLADTLKEVLSEIFCWSNTDNGMWIGRYSDTSIHIDSTNQVTRFRASGHRFHLPLAWSVKYGTYTLAGTEEKWSSQLFRISNDRVVELNAPRLNDNRRRGCFGPDGNGNLRHVAEFIPNVVDGSMVRYSATEPENEGPITELLGIPFTGLTNMFFAHNPYNDQTWVFQGDSLYIFDQKYRRLCSKKIADTELFASNVNSVFFEDEDHAWIASNKGVLQIRITPKRFHSFFTSDKNSLGQDLSHSCRTLSETADGKLLVGTGRGIVSVNLENEKVEQVSRNWPVSVGFSSSGNKLLYIDSATAVVQKLGGNVTLPVSGPNWDLGDEVWAFEPLNKDEYLVGSQRLYRLNTRTKSVEEIIPEPKVFGTLFYQFKRQNDKIWVATSRGLYRYEDGTRKLEHFHSQASEENRIPTSNINGLHIADDGIFWLATADNGLVKWNPKTGESVVFRRKDGLADDLLYGILQDERGFLWISSDNGIIRFDPKSNTAINYGQKDGITELEFNRTSFHKGSSETFYFGSVDGLVSFRPEEFWTDQPETDVPLEIIGFSQDVSSKDAIIDLKQELLQTKAITLHPFDRFFTLQFQLLDFAEHPSHFAYMVEGWDRDWNFITENSVRVSGLEGGSYTLRVKGQLVDGNWSTQELSIPVLVIDPIYERTWFLALTSLLLLAGAIGFFRYRTSRLHRQKEELERIVAERTAQLDDSLKKLDISLKQKETYLKEIHHRVKNNLQIISSLMELEERNIKDPETITVLKQGRNRVKAMALIHKNLYQKEDFGHIEMQTYCNELLGAVRSGSSTSSDKVFLNMETNGIELDIDTAIPLGLIMTELMTNSFKHAFKEQPNGEIGIRLSGNDADYLLEFRDNGQGFPPHQKERKGSLGLNLVRMLTDQIDGTIKFTNDNGAVVTIHFKGEKTRRSED